MIGSAVAIGLWLMSRLVGFGVSPMIRWSLGAVAAAAFAYYLHWASQIPEEAGEEREMALQNQMHGTTASALAVSALFATGVMFTLFKVPSNHSRKSTW